MNEMLFTPNRLSGFGSDIATMTPFKAFASTAKSNWPMIVVPVLATAAVTYAVSNSAKKTAISSVIALGVSSIGLYLIRG